MSAICQPHVGGPAARPLSDVLRISRPVLPRSVGSSGAKGAPVSTPVRASDRDLRALAAIVSQDRPDLPDGEGLPLSLLADLRGQIRCDEIASGATTACGRVHRCSASDRSDDAGHPRTDCTRRSGPATGTACPAVIPSAPVTCAASSRSRTSTRPGNGTAQACTAIAYRPRGMSTSAVPARSRRARTAGPGRTVRLYFWRGPGPDFSERDRALLTLLRPHLHQAYLDAERRRHPVPRLTARQRAAAPAGRRAHQHPDRPPSRDI